VGTLMNEDWPTIPDETPVDPSGLLPGVKGAIRNRRELNVAEAENIRVAIVKYLGGRPPTKRKAPFTLKWACGLHEEMFGNVWTWAGKIRTVRLNPGPEPHQVQEMLYSLLGDLEAWETGAMPLIEQAAILHHRAVHIHPFMNGNGRWARLLSNIWLKQHGAPVVNWPEDTLGGAGGGIRGEYIAAIRQADQLDYEALFELHRRYSLSTQA